MTEFEHDDLLLDHIQFEELLNYRVDLKLLGTRPVNALKRALIQSGSWDKLSNQNIDVRQVRFIELRVLAHLRISDIRDLKNVGASTLQDLVDELQHAISEFDPAESPNLNSPPLTEIELIQQKILTSENIENLTEYMIEYQKSIRNISEREEIVWRNRLPWITDNPRTLQAIASDFGVTRERIRQIQRKSSRYSYQIEGQIVVLAEVQNILLGCSSFEEFRQAMIEEELTTSESITLGRIRHLGVELNQPEVVSDVERAIYAWSQVFPSFGE